MIPLLCVTVLAASDPPPKVRHRLPSLSSVFPQGTTPGAKLRVEVLGEYLDRAGRVVFLDPAIQGKVLSGTYTRLDLELEVSPEAPFGPHYFRVVSPRGASNVLLFRIGDQPHRLEQEPNSTLEQAQDVSVPVTINGRLPADGDFDFFCFRTEAGRTWVFDLRSARNGNGLDAALILLDSEGRKLEHSEDVFIWDPFFTHTFTAAGRYCAVVQPTHARNDPNFAYQLDIRTAPHLETVSPLALTPGSETEATLFGAGLAGEQARLWFDAPGFRGEVLELRGATARVKVRTPADAPPGVRELVLVTEGGRSDPAKFLVDPTPPYRGGVVRPPASITGVARYRQPERFEFEAEAGQTLVFEVRAQRFGSPVDSVLRILDEKGKELAANDDAAFAGVQFNKDSRIRRTFPQAGRYTVEMRNLVNVTGENYPYQLLVKPPEPGFELMLATDQPYVYPGESSTWKVTVDRQDGFNAAIPVTVSGLPAGVSAEPAEIPAGKNETEIRLRAEGAAPGVVAPVEVRAGGHAAWRSVRIAGGGGEGAAFARVRTAALAVAEKPAFGLEATLNTVNLVRGGAAELPVQIQRAAAFHGEIRFSVENLPAGVALEEAVAAPDAASVTLRLRAAPDAPKGRASRVAVLGTSQGQVQEAPRITVQVD